MDRRLKKIYYLVRLIPKLGFKNSLYGFYYKLSLRLGFRRSKFKITLLQQNNFFSEIKKIKKLNIPNRNIVFDKADKIVRNNFTYFFKHEFSLAQDQLWFYNPFVQKQFDNVDKHWTRISDFSNHDIKIIWEQSRFYFVLDLVKAYLLSADKKYLQKMNFLINDWCKHNPVNQGPNWKCGQEAAIRIMNLMYASLVLDQLNDPPASYKEFVYRHVERIVANINYAIIQDNNHGTSESSIMYIGALWLSKLNYKREKTSKWANKGRLILEKRILKLIQINGSFAQRSCNYHRVFIDTMSFVMIMIEKLNDKKFEGVIYDKLLAAGNWQYKMTFGKNGECPNFGSNDGAMLNILHSSSYTDFRPSTDTFFGLLTGSFLYNSTFTTEPLVWMYQNNLPSYKSLIIDLSPLEILDDHIVIMRNERCKLFFKIPDDKFRPGNDAFHIDLWIDEQPILIDSGTYSYNNKLTKSFKSTSAHNTVQFGKKEQMPEISKFLNGEWLTYHDLNCKADTQSIECSASYKDYNNNYHHRKIVLNANSLHVEDTFQSNNFATIRYRSTVNLYDYKLSTNDKMQVHKSLVSNYYLDNKEVFVLEIYPKYTTGISTIHLEF